MQTSLRIAVVDDLEMDRQKLEYMLTSYTSRRELNCVIDNFSRGDEFLQNFMPGKYQLIFLDIMMDGLDGMETARQIRRQDPQVILIFVTIEPSYAIEGYEVEATAFLIKTEGLESKRFERLMLRLEKKLRGEALIQLSEGGSISNLPASSLLYAEIIDHELKLHTADTVYSLRMAMEELKPALPTDNRFFECHRGIVINLDHIQVLGRQVVTMKNGDVLPVSRRKRAELESAYAARSIARIRGGF